MTAQAIAGAIVRDAALKQLVLSGNGITDAGAKKLAEALARDPHLKQLVLHDNKVQ